MAHRTPLFDWHVAHSGRMVDFAGWDMPIQYSTIIDEHQAVRNHAGIFDISHMGRLSFSGEQAPVLIDRVWTNSVLALKDFQVRYGLICNEHGGIRDDVLVYKWPYGYAIVVNASNRLKIVEWLEHHRSAGELKADILDQTLTTCMIAVQGPKAVALCNGLTEADGAQLAYYHAYPTRFAGSPCIVSRTGYTGEDGFEFMLSAAKGIELWESLFARGAMPCGLGARDTLRLEAAMPLYGHELSEEIDPLQAGLGWAVKMDKGDFIGRAAIERRQKNAALHRRVGLELAGKRLAREGSAVQADGKEIGRVCSGTFAPTLQKAIAMAYVDPAYAKMGTAVGVDIRGKTEKATVVRLPFYKRLGKA
jgi:aminomethyltransferase